jgi:hypothetical protein
LISKSKGVTFLLARIATEKFYNYVFPNHDLQNHLKRLIPHFFLKTLLSL